MFVTGKNFDPQPALEDLIFEWMNPLLTVAEMDRLVGWHLGMSLLQALHVVLFCAWVSGLPLP